MNYTREAIWGPADTSKNSEHANMSRTRGQDDSPTDAIPGAFKDDDDEQQPDVISMSTTSVSYNQNSNRLNQHYIVPKTPSNYFTGRRDVLDALATKCLPAGEQVGSVKEGRVFVLHGSAGSGKTQIALKFAQENWHKYWAVFWIDASTNRTAEQSVLDIYIDLERNLPDPTSLSDNTFLQNTIKTTMQRLANAEKPWLLIVDNANDDKMNLKSYIPAGGPGCVLLTTRDSSYAGVRRQAIIGSWKLENLSEKDSKDLLLAYFGGRQVNASDEKKAQGIVRVLQGFPLAISHASCAMGSGAYTIDDVSKLVTTKRGSGTGTKDTPSTTDTIRGALKDYLVQSAKDDRDPTKAGTAAVALNVLSFLSFLHFTGISVDFFRRAWDYCKGKGPYGEYEELRKYLFGPRDLNSSFDGFLASVTLLSSLSLIQFDNGVISMHSLVQKWARRQLEKNEQKEIASLVTDFIFVATPPPKGIREGDLRRKLLPHIDALRKISEDTFIYNIVSRTYGSTIVHIFFDNGMPEEGITIMTGQIALYQKMEDRAKAKKTTFDPMPKYTCMAYLAACYSQQSQHAQRSLETVGDSSQKLDPETKAQKKKEAREAAEKALVLSEQVLKGYIETEGNSSPRTIYRMGQVAGCLRDVGRNDEALKMYQATRDAMEKLKDYEDRLPRTIQLLANMATAYDNKGDTEAAFKLEVEAFNIIKAENVVQPVSVGLMESLVGRYSKMSGRLNHDKGLEVMSKIVEMQTELLRADHPTTVEARKRLDKMTHDYRPQPLKSALRSNSNSSSKQNSAQNSDGSDGARRREMELRRPSSRSSSRRSRSRSSTRSEKSGGDVFGRFKDYVNQRLRTFRSVPDLRNSEDSDSKSINKPSDSEAPSGISTPKDPKIPERRSSRRQSRDSSRTDATSATATSDRESSPSRPLSIRQRLGGLRHPFKFFGLTFGSDKKEKAKARKQLERYDALAF